MRGGNDVRMIEIAKSMTDKGKKVCIVCGDKERAIRLRLLIDDNEKIIIKTIEDVRAMDNGSVFSMPSLNIIDEKHKSH